jgi:DNA polymerase III epsilon subunit-like protein
MYNPTIPLVVTDIETGGLELHHPIIQIAAVVFLPDTDAVLEELELKIEFDPETCESEALKVNHYDPVDWHGAVTIDDGLRQLLKLYRDYAVAVRVPRSGKGTYKVAIAGGYNSNFDADRLFHQARQRKMFLPVDPRFLDVMQLAMWKLDLPSYKLTNVAEHLGISSVGAHDALADVHMTYKVMKKLLELP